MKLLHLYFASTILWRHATAHYVFGRLIVDGKWSQTWEHVRLVSPPPNPSGTSFGVVDPNTDPYSLDLRCGRNATIAWNKPKVAKVQAGGVIGFAAGEPKIELERAPPSIYHPGFASAWLSKAPNDDLDTYTGEGNWFKILSVINRTEQSTDFSDPYWAPYAFADLVPWGTYRAQSWNFTIPKSTPPGKYLLRWEHIFPNVEDSQFYVNCAHLQIVNNEHVGVPGPMVAIPGIYQRGQKEIYFSSYEYAPRNNYDLSKLETPKPEVWHG